METELQKKDVLLKEPLQIVVPEGGLWGMAILQEILDRMSYCFEGKELQFIAQCRYDHAELHDNSPHGGEAGQLFLRYSAKTEAFSEKFIFYGDGTVERRSPKHRLEHYDAWIDALRDAMGMIREYVNELKCAGKLIHPVGVQEYYDFSFVR